MMILTIIAIVSLITSIITVILCIFSAQFGRQQNEMPPSEQFPSNGKEQKAKPAAVFHA